MLSKLSRDKDESGFTLIELLVVILIIGILSSIAIPAFMNQRKSAAEASVKADLKAVATALETNYIKTKAYPSAVPAGVKTSDGVTLTIKPADGSVSIPTKAANGQAADISFRIPQGSNGYQITNVTNQITSSTLLSFNRSYKCVGETAVGPVNGSLNVTAGAAVSWGGTNGECGGALESLTISPATGTINSTHLVPTGSFTVYPGAAGPSTDGFCVEGTHSGESSNVWKYDSKNGGLKQGTC